MAFLMAFNIYFWLAKYKVKQETFIIILRHKSIINMDSNDELK